MVIVAEIDIFFRGIVPRPDGALLLSLNVTDTAPTISHQVSEHCVCLQQVAFSSLAGLTTWAALRMRTFADHVEHVYQEECRKRKRSLLQLLAPSMESWRGVLWSKGRWTTTATAAVFTSWCTLCWCRVLAIYTDVNPKVSTCFREDTMYVCNRGAIYWVTKSHAS